MATPTAKPVENKGTVSGQPTTTPAATDRMAAARAARASGSNGTGLSAGQRMAVKTLRQAANAARLLASRLEEGGDCSTAAVRAAAAINAEAAAFLLDSE